MADSIDSVAIIGVGLIGGSIGLAVKHNCPHIKVIGIGRNTERLRLAMEKGCIDEYTTDISYGVKDADVVVVATPVRTIPDFVKNVLPLVKDGCSITDVASVKYEIIKKVSSAVKKYRKLKDISFVGSHPLAGSEKTGFEYSNKDLFKNSVCVICANTQLCSDEGLKKIVFLWEITGAKIIYLDAKKHDKILAATSHMLHLVSYVLAKHINDKKGYSNFTAGAYRDMTRIAASNPELWAEICYSNRDFIIQELTKLVKELTEVKKILYNFEKLKKFLSKIYSLKVKNINERS